MATTQASSSSAAAAAVADVAGLGFDGAVEDQAAAAGVVVSPELAPSTVAQPRLRRQPSSTGTGKQPKLKQVVADGCDGGVAPVKIPRRGLGVAQLELLRCGGDPLRALSEAAAVMADAGASVHGNSGHLHHHLPPAFHTATADSSYYSSLLVQQHSATVAAPAPVCYAHSHTAAGGQIVGPEQPFMDPWGRVVGGSGNACLIHQNLLPAPAPEHPSSQTTVVWRPSSSSPPCLHTGHNCELCAMMMRAFTERAAAANMPDPSTYDLPADMTAAREEIGEGIHALEGQTEIREIEFFPTSTSQHAIVPAESEFATAPFSASPSTTSGAGDRATPLDLSLKL